MSNVTQKKSIHNKDVFQRVNFLQQASILMAPQNEMISSYYGRLMQQIAKKSVLKVDPTIKRFFCRRCSTALTPATSEVSCKSDSLGVIKCKKCGFEKKYPINDSFKLWSERNEGNPKETSEIKLV